MQAWGFSEARVGVTEEARGVLARQEGPLAGLREGGPGEGVSGQQDGGLLSSAFSGSQRSRGNRTPEQPQEEPWALAGHPRQALPARALPLVGPQLTRGTLPTQASSSKDRSSRAGQAQEQPGAQRGWPPGTKDKHTHANVSRQQLSPKQWGSWPQAMAIARSHTVQA